MGKNARIQELERMLEDERARHAIPQYVLDYIVTLAQMPEDAVLLYTRCGSRISHEIGKSARATVGMLRDAGYIKQ